MDAKFDLALTAGREKPDEFLLRLGMRGCLHGQQIHHEIGAGLPRTANLTISQAH